MTVKLELLRVEQLLDFTDGGITSVAVVRLDSGQEVRMAVDALEDVAALIAAGMGSLDVRRSVTPPAPAEQVEAPPTSVLPPEGPLPTTVLEWSGLHDEVLPAHYKAALVFTQAPTALTYEELTQRIEWIEHNFTAEDWKTILGPAAQAAAVATPEATQAVTDDEGIRQI